jgi:solute carrier family 25 (mitochondrial S-adenosylmethionine transporter), member 26
MSSSERPTPFLTSLIAGGMAGTSVDVALFPIDTIKTRLQSPHGFVKAGGLVGIYNGLGAAAAGSAPGAALFFATYEQMKPLLKPYMSDSTTHMVAASLGEAAACLVRVPTEVVKAKMQTGETVGLANTFRLVLNEPHGSSVFGGLYRGYGITLMREIPFAMIQFPLYEQAKVVWSDYRGSPVSPVQAAACGSATGALAAAATTPLDVLKTRLMLGKDRAGVPYTSAFNVYQRILKEEGAATLFSGVQPRVMWISIGGFVFFGAYETFKTGLEPILG